MGCARENKLVQFQKKKKKAMTTHFSQHTQSQSFFHTQKWTEKSTLWLLINSTDWFHDTLINWQCKFLFRRQQRTKNKSKEETPTGQTLRHFVQLLNEFSVGSALLFFFVLLLFLLSFEIEMEWSSREGDEENNSIFFDSALLRKFLKKKRKKKKKKCL